MLITMGIGLIKHFLWMLEPEGITETKPAVDGTKLGSDQEANSYKTDPGCSSLSEHKPSPPESLDCAKEQETSNLNDEKSAYSKKPKASKKKKNETSNQDHTVRSPESASSGAKSATASNGDEGLALSKTSKNSVSKKKVGDQAPSKVFDKNLIESREEMYDRLKNGTDYNLDEVVGVMVGGTMENPVIAKKTITYPDDEIERLLAEVSEIRHLLFCRLLLGHAALLPAALSADSVEAFLNDQEVTELALRDLCLKMEHPGLQEIRDACADLFRSEEEEEDNELSDEEDIVDDVHDDTDHPYEDFMMLKPEKPKGALPDKWLSKREKARDKMPNMPTREDMLGGSEGGFIDFGETKDDGKFHKNMIRVKICGRTIWNYPSNNAMTRKGWLHFCIIAKDSSLYDAVALCRHWDEFFDLNILAVWHYFPGANWLNWVGSRYRQQMLQLGFIMYFESVEPDAWDLTRHHQTGRGGPYKRSFAVLQARNFICAHIKRDDTVSRRFIQYLHMQSHRLLMLVRDAETGRILVKPPEEERWLIREKSGLGRAIKGHWNVIKAIGPKFFEEMDRYRKWNFGFKEYYDIYLWDLPVGESFPALYNAVQEVTLLHSTLILVNKYTSTHNYRRYLKRIASALEQTFTTRRPIFSRHLPETKKATVFVS
jgi:hypothetical protein